MKTQLLDRLTIGNWHDARDRGQGYYIITVAEDCEFRGNEFFPLKDAPGNSTADFLIAVQAVINAYQAGKNVLVHCVGGRSRSAAVCVAAISLISGRSINDSYNHVIDTHSEARIHPYLSMFLTA